LQAKPSGTGAGSKDTIEDADLIASMAKRLTVLEANLRDRNNLLQKAQADNEALRGKVSAELGQATVDHLLAATGCILFAAHPCGPGPKLNIKACTMPTTVLATEL
jgi:hypothetical protein